MRVYHYDIVKDILGFGRRLIVWMSGCPFSCHGCIVENLQDINNGDVYKNFYDEIQPYLSEIDGITFSGGEPLYQSKELFYLLKLLPKDLDKMLFTGYQKSELNSMQLKCYHKFDLVIEDRFDINKMGDFLWRGSKNQKISSPTNKYHKELIKSLYKAKSAGLEVKVTKNELIFYGIPTNNNEINKIKNLLQQKLNVTSNMSSNKHYISQ